MKRVIMWFVVIAVLLLAAFKFDGAVPGDRAVRAVAPDPRVVWVPYPVGGLGLCSPDTCIGLPPGSILLIPTLGDTLRKSLTEPN